MKDSHLADIQNSPAPISLNIDRVGIRRFRTPVIVRDRVKGHCHTVAEVDMGVDLPGEFKGTHMSRFVEALEDWRQNGGEVLEYRSIKRLLEQIRGKLHARDAFADFCFPYFRSKKAPATGITAVMSYDCRLSAALTEGSSAPVLELTVTVPVTTVCPCSKAISSAGAHGQRADIRMTIRMRRFEWMEDFIDIAESSGSAPLYSLLKREDEKVVTEQAYAHAYFVEDVVRNVADRLSRIENVTRFRVEVESYESIHEHNAYACIERNKEEHS